MYLKKSKNSSQTINLVDLGSDQIPKARAPKNSYCLIGKWLRWDLLEYTNKNHYVKAMFLALVSFFGIFFLAQASI